MSRSRLNPARSQPHASPPAETALSRNFVTSALKAAALSDLWIASDRDRAVDAVQLATVATASDSDRRALEELLALFANVQSWSDARVDEERKPPARNVLRPRHPAPCNCRKTYAATNSRTEYGLMVSTMRSNRRPHLEAKLAYSS